MWMKPLVTAQQHSSDAILLISTPAFLLLVSQKEPSQTGRALKPTRPPRSCYRGGLSAQLVGGGWHNCSAALSESHHLKLAIPRSSGCIANILASWITVRKCVIYCLLRVYKCVCWICSRSINCNRLLVNTWQANICHEFIFINDLLITYNGSLL